MAFDGTTIAAVRKELSDSILGGRIYKIAQPEPDELLITIKTPEGQRKLYISASASLPLIYLTDANKPSPMTAPNFCMLLRKHIANGRIVDIWQPKLERIIHFTIEHLDELGDLPHGDAVVVVAEAGVDITEILGVLLQQLGCLEQHGAQSFSIQNHASFLLV